MGAPQIIVAILLVIEITRSAVKHGQMKEREHFGKKILDVIATILLLKWGGFF